MGRVPVDCPGGRRGDTGVDLAPACALVSRNPESRDAVSEIPVVVGRVEVEVADVSGSGRRGDLDPVVGDASAPA